MQFHDVVGQRSTKDFLEQYARSMPNGILLYGQRAVGKYSLAKNFIQGILCSENTGCGKCGRCVKVAQSAHPDVHILNPVDGIIGIDAIRGLRERWSYARSEAEYKFGLMRHADLMTSEASQVLLKLLEEPGDKCCVMMTTHNALSVPVTILSRSHVVKCARLSQEELSEVATRAGIKIDTFSAWEIWNGSFLPDEWVENFSILNGAWDAKHHLPEQIDPDLLRKELRFLAGVLNFMMVREADSWREIRLRRPRTYDLSQAIWVIERSLGFLKEQVSSWLIAKRTVSQLRAVLS